MRKLTFKIKYKKDEEEEMLKRGSIHCAFKNKKAVHCDNCIKLYRIVVKNNG